MPKKTFANKRPSPETSVGLEANAGTGTKSSTRIVASTIIKILLLLVWTGGVLFFVQFLLGFLFRAIYQNTALSEAATQTAYSAISYLIAFCIIILVPLKLQTKNPKTPNMHKTAPSKAVVSSNYSTTKGLRAQLGLIGWPTWTDLALAPIGFIVYVVLAAIVTNLFNLFPWFDVTEVQQTGYNAILLGGDRLLAFIALVVIAPVAEELIFRGFLYGKIKRLIRRARTTNRFAIIISTLLVSILFGLMHGQWNVGINVFTMSIVLCLLREVTGTTYAGIFLHVIKNLIAFYLIFILH